MSFRQSLRRARSHIIIIIVLIAAGTTVVRIEDDNLERETGKPVPDTIISGKGALSAP